MSDSTGEAPPPDAPAPEQPDDPKRAEARALAEFHASVRQVTPRIGFVWAIVALNVAVYAVMVARGVPWMEPQATDLVAWGADFGPRTLNGQWWRLVTNFFLHFGALHLFMNMLALWSAGPLVERIYGSARTSAIYLFAGVVASVASIAIHPRSVSAGASGAVFGIYGALGAFLLRHRGSVPALALKRLGNVAGTFIIYNVIFGFTHPAIDNAAHLGGLAGGALAGAWLARPLGGDRPRAPGRVALVFVLAALVVGIAPRLLKAPPDLDALVEQLRTTELRVTRAYNAIVEDLKAKKITEDGAADRIERELLPAWRAARERLAAPRAWTPREREWLERVDRYTAAKEQLWEALVFSLRTHTPAAREAVDHAAREVMRLTDELKPTDPAQ